METYTLLRQLADSWFLLAMFAVFLGVVFWAFRPGSRPVHDDTANIPFRYETAPASAPRAQKGAVTGGADNG